MLFESLGPDAPTLCEGWTTRDLAAHLWVRDHRPWAVPGMVAKGGALHRSTDRMQQRVAERPFAEIVASLKSGAPAHLPVLREAVDLHEFFVHHEDVRRANDAAARAHPALDKALWQIIPLLGRFLTRTARGVEIALVTPFGRRLRVRSGDHWVEARGRPQELFLWLYNRPADVEVRGDEEGLARLAAVRLGM